MHDMLNTFVRDERAAASAEYSLLIGFIALIILGAVRALGITLPAGFATVHNLLAGA